MFLDTRIGGEPRWYAARPKDWAMRIPELFRKSVVFLGRVIQKGAQEELAFRGTGFLVTVPSVSIPDRKYLHLVTAQHVADQLSLGEWVLRINTAGGRFRDIRLKDITWLSHPAEPADVAVTFASVPEDADCNVLPERVLLDEKTISDYGIGAGDEVYITGLFTKAPGRSRILPLTRTGNIALIPDPGELIPGIKTKAGAVDADVYLIEARSIGGLSGSPVFVRATVADKRMVKLQSGEQREQICTFPGDFFLLGLLHGHWDIPPEERNEPDPRPHLAREGAVNLGIAVVVPAKKIRETLYHPWLVEARHVMDQQAKDAAGTTTPDTFC